MNQSPHGPCVLLADEDRLLLGLLSHRFRGAGFRVETVDDAEDVVPVLERADVHMAVLSLTLPGRTGLELLKRLRSRPESRSLPVLALTMPGDDRLVIDALEAGADEVVERPIVPQVLVARIRRLIRPSLIVNPSESPLSTPLAA